MDFDSISARYHRDGFAAPLPLLSEAEAAEHRRRLEAAEAEVGPLHYRYDIHATLTSPWELASRPDLLDIVECVLGPDILLYSTTYIVKEPHTTARVSWHQDLTYWGFENDDVVNIWLALSPATAESGCMMMVPGSHHAGRRQHATSDDPDNILDLGQSVVGVDTSTARLCALQPGELSVHHGWTVHSSQPNQSDDRRIGLNIQYVSPANRQLRTPDNPAILVRGQDRFGYYNPGEFATTDLDPAALARQAAADKRYAEIYTKSNQSL